MRCRNNLGSGNTSVPGVDVMITQYSEYGTVPSAALNLMYSKISVLDEYIICRTGENQYTAMIRSPATKETTEIVVQRVGTGYTNTWEVTEQPSNWGYNVKNEYYVYSNIGIGTMQVLPCHEITQTYCMAGFICVLFLAIMFKGVLFPCLRRLKN